MSWAFHSLLIFNLKFLHFFNVKYLHFQQWWKNCTSVCMCLHACVCKYALKNAWKHAWTMLTAHSPISSEILWSYWERSPLKMMNQSSPTLFHFPWKVQMWWPKGDNFKHPHTWHPYNASCFHYGNLSVSLWDTVILQLVCGDALSCSALSDLLPFHASLSYSVYFSFFYHLVYYFTCVEDTFLR